MKKLNLLLTLCAIAFVHSSSEAGTLNLTNGTWWGLTSNAYATCSNGSKITLNPTNPGGGNPIQPWATNGAQAQIQNDCTITSVHVELNTAPSSTPYNLTTGPQYVAAGGSATIALGMSNNQPVISSIQVQPAPAQAACPTGSTFSSNSTCICPSGYNRVTFSPGNDACSQAVSSTGAPRSH